MGQRDGFEDQPLALDGRDRGHPIGGTVTTEQAHAGKQSLKFTGTIGVGSPTLCVRPGVKYRLEAWLRDAGVSVQYVEWAGGRADGEPMKAASSKAGEWELVTLEFTGPAWGPALDLKFHATGGAAYLDDFLLAPVAQ
jgi:hypothetical protein